MSRIDTSRAEKFEFRGSASEWFGIWIVNLLLSIITLGIYSAWAKVRRKKYFYANTFVEGRNFDYHATGGQILKGRIIVVVALIAIQLVAAISPVMVIVIYLLILVAYPWLLTRAMMFNARMSSFSNVRFNFVGTAGRAFVVFMIYPVLTVLTLYTTAPLLHRTTTAFSINNHRLGVAKFKLDVSVVAFYKAAGFALLWIIAVFAVAFVFGGFSTTLLQNAMYELQRNSTAGLGYLGLFYGVFFLGFLPAAFIYQALIRNDIYKGTSLDGGHRMHSDVTPAAYIWIAVSNLIVVVCTLGLMLPWAHIRMAKYLAAHTGVELGGPLDDFVSDQTKATSALGDAYVDIEGIDVGLPM